MEHNNQYKSVFLSDIHLGFNGCSVDKLEHFMDSMSCDNLFLVGDIVDLWAMKDKFYWPLSHQKMLQKSKSGGDFASGRFGPSFWSWGILGRASRFFVPSWGVLGASRRVLGAVLGRPCGVLGRLKAYWG